MDHAATIETLNAMKAQEAAAYFTKTGLYEDTPVDAMCRLLMVNWSNNVADFCKFSRDTVAISIHNMDRYFAKQPKGLHDKREFQLIAMASLYMAIKVNEPEAIDPSTVAKLSKGVYSADEIEIAEREIITTLQWRVNPPTAMAFVENYLKLLPAYPVEIWDIIHAQIDLAVGDACFLGTDNSCIGLEAVFNALSLLSPSLLQSTSSLGIRKSMELNNVSVSIQDKLMARARTAVVAVPVRPALIRRECSKEMSSNAADLSPRCIAMAQS